MAFLPPSGTGWSYNTRWSTSSDVVLLYIYGSRNRLYFDGVYPVGSGSGFTFSKPAPVINSGPRVWYSQPRNSNDPTSEVITIKFKKPVAITDFSMGILAVPSKWSVFGIDDLGKTTELISTSLQAIGGTLSGASTTVGDDQWTTVTAAVRPVTINGIQIRLTRIKTGNNNSAFSLGCRDILLKRTVKTQQDTLLSLSDQVDAQGNYVRHDIVDWSARKAIDDDAMTFWRSGPQPDPNAVVNLYASVGNGIEGARIDRFYLDPVYTNNTMNVYYSMDDSIASFLPEPNRGWGFMVNPADKMVIKQNVGLDLTNEYAVYTSKLFGGTGIVDQSGVTDLSAPSKFPYPKTGWFGIDWAVPASLPVGNIMELVYPDNTSLDAISVTRNADGSWTLWVAGDSVATTDSISTSPGDTLQFVGATIPDEDDSSKYTIRFIISKNGEVVFDGVSDLIPLKNGGGFTKFYYPGAYASFAGGGTLRAFILKANAGQEGDYLSFSGDPQTYVSVDSWFADKTTGSNAGEHTSSNMEYAVFVGDYLSGLDGYGGADQNIFTNKTWTPIWKDWKTQRGFYYLPSPIIAKHLKFEFSQLTEQPYPMWESGTTVDYMVFPPNAINGSRSFIDNQQPAAGGTGSSSLQRPNYESNTPAAKLIRASLPNTPVYVTTSVVNDIRNLYLYDSSALIRTESANVKSLKSSVVNNSIDLSSSLIRTLISPTLPLASSTNSDYLGKALDSISPTAIRDASNSSSLGSRSPGWWTLPGGEINLPQSVMDSITASSTVTERAVSSSEVGTTRVRFAATSIHHYDKKTVTRDAGLAYFAGIREFQAFNVDYSVPSDTDSYQVIITDSTIFPTTTNMTLGTQDTAMHPTTDAYADATSITMPSIGTFIKAGMSVVDRGIHSAVKNLPFGAITPEDDAELYYWDDGTVTWDDTVATWGAMNVLARFDFDTNIFFFGKQASRINKDPGVGVAGFRTNTFQALENARIRLCATIFRQNPTSNITKISLVDTTPITGSVLKEFEIDAATGMWVTFKSDWFVMDDTYENLQVQIVTDGADPDEFYVGNLYEEQTTIVYMLSNDDGATYYEANEIVDEDNKFLIFPAPGNKLKVKILMYDPLDYVFGFTVTPVYLF